MHKCAASTIRYPDFSYNSHCNTTLIMDEKDVCLLLSTVVIAICVGYG